MKNKYDTYIKILVVISSVLILLPIFVINIDYLKSIVLLVFRSKDNSTQYLQFVGTFLGVIITIIITILLQNKNMYFQESKEVRYSKNYIYTQLHEAFNEYLTAKKENKEKSKDKEFYYPKQIYIDPNWMETVAKIQPYIDECTYQKICFAFIQILNVDKKCEKIKDRISSMKNKDYNNYTEVFNDVLNSIKNGDYTKFNINNLEKEISEYIDQICDLYNHEYKSIIEYLKNYNINMKNR